MESQNDSQALKKLEEHLRLHELTQKIADTKDKIIRGGLSLLGS